MQIYLIYQITISHPTRNNMVYVSAFPCPRRLFSSHIGSWHCWPQPREATKLILFQPPEVYKVPEMGQNYQSCLNCVLDNTSPRPASTSTSAATSGCPIPRLQEAVPVVTSQDVLANAPLTFTPSQSHLSRCTCKCTIDSYSQVNLPLKTCSLMHHWLSLTSHHEHAIQVHPQERAIQMHG